MPSINMPVLTQSLLRACISLPGLTSSSQPLCMIPIVYDPSAQSFFLLLELRETRGGCEIASSPQQITYFAWDSVLSLPA